MSVITKEAVQDEIQELVSVGKWPEGKPIPDDAAIQRAIDNTEPSDDFWAAFDAHRLRVIENIKD